MKTKKGTGIIIVVLRMRQNLRDGLCPEEEKTSKAFRREDGTRTGKEWTSASNSPKI
jgi:hypothetical protein